MKVSLIQMDMRLGDPDYNFSRAEALARKAAKERPDFIVLPETWNAGFFPKENLKGLCDTDGKRVRQAVGGLAKEFGINIVAGSVANLKGGAVYNTAYIFDRAGSVIASYDKTHLFSPMGEDKFFNKGGSIVTFQADGVSCGIVICYDIRFAELVRRLALKKIDILFVAAQWPQVRLNHWQILNRARAIENQMFVACVNSCGKAGDVKYAGHSALISPWGEVIVEAGSCEEIITGDLDLSVLTDIRGSINVYRDRRPDLYSSFAD